MIVLESKSLKITLNSGLFQVPDWILSSWSKLYSTNTAYIRQRGTVREMKDHLPVKNMTPPPSLAVSLKRRYNGSKSTVRDLNFQA